MMVDLCVYDDYDEERRTELSDRTEQQNSESNGLTV